MNEFPKPDEFKLGKLNIDEEVENIQKQFPEIAEVLAVVQNVINFNSYSLGKALQDSYLVYKSSIVGFIDAIVEKHKELESKIEDLQKQINFMKN